jgi:hypothetical protein
VIWKNTYYKNIFQRVDGSQYTGIGTHRTREQAQYIALLQKPDSIELVYRIKVTPKYPKRAASENPKRK